MTVKRVRRWGEGDSAAGSSVNDASLSASTRTGVNSVASCQVFWRLSVKQDRSGVLLRLSVTPVCELKYLLGSITPRSLLMAKSTHTSLKRNNLSSGAAVLQSAARSRSASLYLHFDTFKWGIMHQHALYKKF
jgi:hypothetical protein